MGVFETEYVISEDLIFCSAFSFGYLPGVWVLKADVSEHSISSIFIGRSMKYDRGWDVSALSDLHFIALTRDPTGSRVSAVKCTSDRADGPSSSASKNMKDTSGWFNLTNQWWPNTVSIRTTSSDYRTPNSSPPKPATWIVSSEKPSK